MAKKLGTRKRIRGKISGTSERPRLNIFRSSKYIYAQIVNDDEGKTLVGIWEKSLKEKGTKTERATKLGEKLADEAIAKKITKLVFDRGVNRYHGRIKAVAESMRKKGLDF